MGLPWSKQTDSLAVLAMVKQELEPLRADLSAMRAEMKEALSATYSREMVDQMFKRLAEEVTGLKDEQERMKKATIDHRELMWSRAGIIVSVGYVLLNVLPHLGNLLKP